MPLDEQLDLDAYLARIGWAGPLRADHATLAGLLRAHMDHVPFENLDVLLGHGIRLDLAGLQDKLVHQRRGGYCFEQATLFAAVLERLGFSLVRHTARVVMRLPRHEAPRTHMFLTVQLPEGRFVADPGLGGLACRAPLPLVDGQRVQVEAQTHWLQQEGHYWWLRTLQQNGQPADAWVGTLDPENPQDFEMGNHYTASHPSSGFVNRIMLRAYMPGGQVTVSNRDVTVRGGEQVQTSQLADRAALRALLQQHFGFDLPQVERMRVPSIPEWT
jgi:N-hydroxyarylamine O-acetyltransferase